MQPPQPMNLGQPPASSSSTPPVSASYGALGNENGTSMGPPSLAPLPLPMPYPTQNPRVHDVRITVRWPLHGEHRLLCQTLPNKTALQSAALMYVREHPEKFGGQVGARRPIAELPNSSGNQQQKATASSAKRQSKGGSSSDGNLQAVVRQALFNNEAYDMMTYRGDDLARLFSGMYTSSPGAIPSFDIEIVERQQLRLVSIGPGPGPGPAPTM